jgi:predicted dehydrogenase
MPERNQNNNSSVDQQPRLAVFGCGAWGKNIVRTVHRLGYLSAVVDPSEVGQKNVADIAPDLPCYSDLKNVLNDDSIRGVMIATPAETHFAIARDVILAGKDVFVEKPMTIDLGEAAELVRLAETEGKLLMVGHLLEYHPAICKIEELVQSGELGNIQYIVSNRLNLGKLRTEENVLWSFAPHDLSVIIRLMRSSPTQVVATGGTFLTPGIADTTLTQLLFKNGARAHVFVSWLHPFKEQKLVVIGDKKMITFCDVTKELILYDQRVDWIEGAPIPVRGDSGVAVEFSDESPLDIECQHFADCVATRQTPRTDGRSGLRILSILHDSQNSLDNGGQPVTCRPSETSLPNIEVVARETASATN